MRVQRSGQMSRVIRFLCYSLILTAFALSGCAMGYYQRGIACWYGKEYHGKPTANGEVYNMYSMTAAHRTLPFGTIVRVRDVKTGRTVDVRINNRGPFVRGRIIDLSYAAAVKMDMIEKGLIPVEITILKSPPKK